jgi:hypothetical protein
MNCLKNIIGVLGCESDTRPLIYLNRLPGVSIKSLDMIANEDQITYLGVIDDIITRAGMRLEIDMLALGGIRLTQDSQAQCLGRLVEPVEQKIGESGLQGMVFTFRQSKYLTLKILSLFFYSPITQNVTFYVIDAVTNEVYDTIPAQLQPGDNEIPINRSYYPRRSGNFLLVVYEGEGVSYYETIDEPCYDECQCRFITACGNKRMGFKDDFTEETFGLGVKFIEECSVSRLICENASLVANALLYAAGVEYVLEVMGSSRLNRFTSVKVEDYNKLLAIFESAYKKALTAALKNIDVCDGCCFDCENIITYTYASP